MALIHFLIVYDRARGEVRERLEFHNAQKASAEYARLEIEHRGDENLEIVLIGSDSIETVMKTHSNYFGDDDLSTYLRASRVPAGSRG